jgi:16S rRNA (uracil1498-N3)-methyltransferase
MQLFLTNFDTKWNSITIKNREILDQIRKVLRMKIWDHIFVQQENHRLEIEITEWDSSTLHGNIVNTINYSWSKNEKWIAIAMPNKWDKVELIVQKLTEIWIKNIYFRPSERSIIRTRNDKKIQRINSIAREAIEQSWWWYLPDIQFQDNISEIIKWKNIVVFDKSENQKTEKTDFPTNTIWIIWPEWWLTQKDYTNFWDNIQIVSLWDTILRTETASIIAWRLINK